MNRERLKAIDSAYRYLVTKDSATKGKYFVAGVIVGILLNMGVAALLM